MLVHLGCKMSMHYFSCLSAPFADRINSVGTHYAELVFLHLVGYVGHVVRFVASGMRNIDALHA
jgi:hypothetical protein